jgi:hypothetical protein
MDYDEGKALEKYFSSAGESVQQLLRNMLTGRRG